MSKNKSKSQVEERDNREVPEIVKTQINNRNTVAKYQGDETFMLWKMLGESQIMETKNSEIADTNKNE